MCWVPVMRQVDELASNSLDLENYAFPPAEFKAGGELDNEIAVELVGAGGILRPEGGDAVEVSSPDGWAPALQKLSAEGFAPERTGIVFIAGDVNYQAVVTAMDSVMAAGYTQIAIGSGSNDGDPKDADSAPTEAIDLKSEPVIVISKTEVKINGTAISALDELERGDARQALVQRLAATQTAPRAVIVQADKDVPFTAVLATIDAIREAGIDDVRFAVDRK